MPRPTSFRLPEDLLDRLEAESRSARTSITQLVSALLDEGLKTRRFPGIVYRAGPAGRRAGLVGGPDVWEVVRDLAHAPGRGMDRVENLAAETGLPAASLLLAADFYTAFPEEVDALIEANERAAEEVRRQAGRREQLLSP
ncbi:MAG: CopG family transcriptional regulator [Acidimicrobiia bacterium]|nr:CopG family transcriptional regulator [Acidimicrobiia bacterium]MYC44646.1 CopG family transcriptional regulator [Acidimicrobiia bacterium]MYI20559.1 CopG family transcriptional regulator [Acidimicrobiia bacterium]